MSSGPVSGADLWNGVLEELSNTKPIAVEYARKSTFLGMTNKDFEIGLPPSEGLSRDALLRDALRSTIEGILQKASGVKINLIVSLKEGLTVPDMPVFDSDDPEPEPEQQPAAVAQQAAKAEAAAAEEGDPAAAEEDIHDDPLIKDALRIFEAEIQS